MVLQPGCKVDGVAGGDVFYSLERIWNIGIEDADMLLYSE